MSDVTEIYICKEGQRLEDGDLFVSHDIDSREQAEQDAFRICRKSSSIHRVAYYKFNEAGDHKLFYGYTNPKVGQKKQQTIEPAADDRGRTVFVLKPGFWQRLRRRLGAE